MKEKLETTSLDELTDKLIGTKGTKKRDKLDAKVAKAVINERIGNKIKEARKAKGLTQDQLAEIMGIGRSAISKLENGTKDFQMSTVAAAAWALGLDIDLV